MRQLSAAWAWSSPLSRLQASKHKRAGPRPSSIRLLLPRPWQTWSRCARKLRSQPRISNASRQAVDAAIQQNASARAKLAGSESRARLDWGMKLASAADAASARLRADVVSGAVTLFHAEFPGRLGVANTLHYELLNARGAPVVLEFIDRSRTPAQFAAGDSALLALRAQSATGVSFRPNERVPIVATTFGSARAFVPAAAALAYQGRLWCYVARSTDRFERVPLDSEASSTEGYAAGESIKAGDQVVVRGAALLLSLERSASSDVGSSTDE
jgi:hypothetical protein